MAIGKWNPFTQQVPVTQDSSVPIPLPIPCADGKQFGLENFGNTCYANSVLQALYFCSPFRRLVIQHADPYTPLRSFASQCTPAGVSTTSNPSAPVRRKPERRPTIDASSSNGVPHPPTPPVPSAPRTLFAALRSLYIHISENPADRGTVAPRVFIEKLRELNEAFRNTMHQDAHEFLIYLLNRIVEEIEEERKQQLASADDSSRSVNSLDTSPFQSMMAGSSSSASHSPGSTFIHQIFEGVLTSETRCLTCENVSSRDESFLDLSIDIEQNSSVTACLRQFSASEMLCQKNKFFCDACCDLQEAEKRMKIKRLPNVLALHLKRFKYQEDVQRYIKLMYRVVFPFELRLFNTVDDASNPDRLYELFAIVVHIGNGPNHGHYVSIIKTMGTWLVFDDEAVEMIKECDISRYFGESNAGSAYVLYYQAANLDLTSLGLRPPTPVHIEKTVPPPTLPQSDVTDSPSSISQTLPQMPPGLSHEPRIPPAAQATAFQPSAPLIPPQEPPQSPITRSPRKSASQLFKINLGSPSSPTRASTIGPGQSPEAILLKRNGFLRPLRPMGHGNFAEEKPDSLGNSATTTFSPPLPKDPTAPELHPHPSNEGGKEKDEKRMASWFRKKSLKSIGKPRQTSETSAERPPLPLDVLLGTGPASSYQPPSPPQQNAARLPSEPLVDYPLTSNQRRSTAPSGRPHTSSPERHTHRQMPPVLSATASMASTTGSSSSSDRYARALPPIPGSPHGPKVSQAQSPFSRGSSDFVYSHRPHNRGGQHLSPKMPPRPATSSGPIGADASPSRSMNGFALSSRTADAHAKENGDALALPFRTKGLPPPPGPHAVGTAGRPKEASGRPQTSHGFHVPTLASASNAAGTAGTSIRRATRKLSWATPMLGFKRSHKSSADHSLSPMRLLDTKDSFP